MKPLLQPDESRGSHLPLIGSRKWEQLTTRRVWDLVVGICLVVLVIIGIWDLELVRGHSCPHNRVDGFHEGILEFREIKESLEDLQK